MMTLSELPEEKWNTELLNRLDKVLTSSADNLEAILRTIDRS
jgi:hypothetical protein